MKGHLPDPITCQDISQTWSKLTELLNKKKFSMQVIIQQTKIAVHLVAKMHLKRKCCQIPLEPHSVLQVAPEKTGATWQSKLKTSK
jgi:hypothetical protein